MRRAAARGAAAATASLLALIACGGCAGRRDEPRFFRTEGGRRLHLPPRRRLALWKIERDFRVLGENDFAYWVREGRPGRRDSRGEPEDGFAVLADFDGNGWRDAALLGASADTLRTVVLLCDADSVRTTIFRQRGFDPPKELGKVETFLTYVAPGRLPPSWNDVDSTVVLDRPAFAEVDFRKGTITHAYGADGWHSAVETK